MNFIENANVDTFVHDLGRTTTMRLTFHAAPESRPVWSADGKSVYFRSEADGPGVYEKAADGGGEARKLVAVTGDGSPNAVTPDGKHLLFSQVDPTTGRDVWTLNLSDGKATVLVNGPGNQGNAVVSPNGRWLAYHEESMGGALVVRPFPDVSGGMWHVVSSGAKWPYWSRDGQELFYQTGRSIRAVRVEADGGSFKWSPSRLLFEGPYLGFGGLTGPRNYDVAADGRFLVIKDERGIGDAATEIVVVQNWIAELQHGNR